MQPFRLDSFYVPFPNTTKAPRERERAKSVGWSLLFTPLEMVSVKRERGREF